ncbi:MAG TPA: DUF2238 domain-containing protein [Candidatus Nanoarchaeia archaeon]|nr:DUF2238 domain-containing protein [Candidatus Nanoarchaeia archaeon]
MGKEKGSRWVIRGIILAIIAYLVFFFLGASYNNEAIARAIITIASLALFIYSWKKSFFHFFAAALSGIAGYVALEVSFDLNIWITALLSFVFAIAGMYFYDRKQNSDRYAAIMLWVFVIVWAILAFNVSYRHDWILENLLTVPFVIFIVVLHRWFKLSKVSYSLLFIYTTLHIVGSHYTYSEVPLGHWMQIFFDLGRNHYDRIVHFSFGFLLAYPVREIYMRIAGGRGIWALWIPVELTFGLSAIYEIIEWLIAVLFGGDLGIAYLGSQGDIWDAQKDMVLAGIGSIIAMAVVFVVLLVYHRKGYWKEFKESFRVKYKRALGEEALARFVKRR